MRGKVVSVIILILLLVSVLPFVFDVQPVEAEVYPGDPEGDIKLVPSSVVGFCSSDLYPGPNNTKFDVTVIIGDITGCIGYWFKINYNSTLLTLDSWTFDTDPANPMSPTQMAPDSADRVDTDASVAGTVQLACLWKLGVGVPSGNYTFDSVAARLTFQIIFIPPPLMDENNNVSTQLALDRTEPSWYHRSYTEIFFLTYSDGYYEYTTRERLIGDVDGDRDIDVGDQRKVQLAMFSYPGHPNWDPNMDVDGDLDVDVGDQRIQQLHMFESW